MYRLSIVFRCANQNHTSVFHSPGHFVNRGTVHVRIVEPNLVATLQQFTFNLLTQISTECIAAYQHVTQVYIGFFLDFCRPRLCFFYIPHESVAIVVRSLVKVVHVYVELIVDSLLQKRAKPLVSTDIKSDFFTKRELCE
jgi:hypothetical protein